MQYVRNATTFAWAVVALWIAVTLTSFFVPAVLAPNTARYINVALLSVFTFVHGARRYGGAGIAAYFVIAVVVTNVFENLSIVTGFPFGAYHHTANMGPQIGHVPLIVGPIFAVAGYLAWIIAGLLLDDIEAETTGRVAFARALVAAFVTTSWDLCVDAIGGTVNRDWVWADGGAWFGVPWINFFGWMLTMWVIFRAFAWCIAKRRVPVHVLPASDPFWSQAVAYWTLIALQFPLLALIVPDFAVTDPAGREWHTGDLFRSMAIASVFTMLFASVLAYARLRRARGGAAA